MTSGLIADRYKIERQLGQGATATVHLARDTQRGIAVAIKILRPELAKSRATDRFLKEIRRTSQLQHPHILQVLDSGEYEGRPFFVLPYMEGGTLRKKLGRSNQLPFDETISILRTVASALDHAHGKGLVHRDIKPENILFTNGQACVGDFGIARVLETVYGTDGTTSSDTIRGTYAYMSPEQAAGSRDIDGRSDIYSLACVAYEMITGMQAFIGPTPESVVAQRFAFTPREVRAYRPSAPPAADIALAKAFAMSPADRYRTTSEFIDALALAVTDAPAPTLTHLVTPAPRQRFRRVFGWSPRVAIPVVLVVAISVAAARWQDITSWMRPDGDSLSDNVVAIAPFDVLDPADTLWRHGVVDLLSRNFDGAGPLRTVPPSVVIKHARGRVDAASAGMLAQRTGAGLVVFGQLLRAGADSARLMATMLDVKRGVTFHVDLRDLSQRFDRLADSLTFAMLRELGRTRTIAAVPRATLGSRSMPALKAFLQGEQLYRANNMVAASETYQRAIALDTTFALAYRRMRSVHRAIRYGSENDSLSFYYALKAGAMNRGLSPRDSLLVVADSLAASNRLGVSFYDPMTLHRVRRRMAALEAAVLNYPSDAEAWYELGEARFHFGERVGVTQRRTLDAFLQSLQLDPNFGPAYYHVIDLTQVLEGTATALTFVRQYRQLRPDDARFRIVATVLEGESEDAAEIFARIAQHQDTGVIQGLVPLRRWPDPKVSVPTLFHQLMARPGSSGDSARARLWTSITALYRGQLRLAARLLDQSLVADLPINVLQLALFGTIPRDSASQTMHAWLAGPDLRRLALSLAWWSAQSDTIALRRAAQRFDSLLKSTRQPTDSAYGSIGSRTVQGYLALARSDTTSALRHFMAVPDSLCSWFCSPYRLTVAQLLVVRGEAARAAAFLDLHPPSPAATSLHEPMWSYERARVAELLGDTATAERLYRYVAAVWARADIELQPAVIRARSRIAVAR